MSENSNRSGPSNSGGDKKVVCYECGEAKFAREEELVEHNRKEHGKIP